MRRTLVHFVLAGVLVLAMLAVTHAAAPPLAKSPRVDAVGNLLPDDAVARFGTARFRATGILAYAALSPDGRLIAVSTMHAIRLLDPTTGKEVGRIKTNGYYCGEGTITFSPDGKSLAHSQLGTIMVCDVIKREVLGYFKTSGGNIDGLVSFSGDGKLLAAGGATFRGNLSITIWDAAQKEERTKFDAAHDWQAYGALSPDGKTVAIYGQDSYPSAPNLRLLNIGTGKERLTLNAASHSFHQALFSPDGKHLLTVEHGSPLSIYDVATGKVLRRFAPCANVTVVSYSPDGTRLATGAVNGTVQLWDPLTGKRLGQCKAPPLTKVTSIAFLPGNKVLAAGISHQMIRLWGVPSGRERTPAVGHVAPVSSVAFSRDGEALLSAAADGLQTRSLVRGKTVRQREAPSDEYGSRIIRFMQSTSVLSGNGRYMVWVGWPGVTVVDLDSGEEIIQVQSFSSSKGTTVAFAPDSVGLASLWEERAGKNRYVCGQVWDLESGLLKRKVKVPATIDSSSVALSPGAKMLAIASSGQVRRGTPERIALWDVATGKEITRLPVDSADKMVFSPDGSMLATAWDGVSLWEAITGQLVVHLKDEEGRGHKAIAFSPDGKLLAVMSGATDSEADEIRLWEVVTGKVRAVFPGHLGGTLSLAFSPDGRLLASGGTDTTVMVWDVTGVTGLSRLHRRKPTAADLATLWADLDNADAGKAHKAMARQLAWPTETMTLFRKELKPAAGKPPEEKVVQRWITELGDDSFEIREKASKALSDAGDAVRSALVKTLASTSDLEKKRRLQALLRALRPGPPPEMIRRTRALEVLERMGTPEARQLLRQLAGGNPSARLTTEAVQVLKRLERAR
jgi:WD40 repeat protein